MRAKIQKFVTLSSLGICFLTVCILWYGIERTPGQLLKNSKEQLSSSSRRSNYVVNQAKSASECSEFQKELLRTGFTYPGCHSRYSTFYLRFIMCRSVILQEKWGVKTFISSMQFLHLGTISCHSGVKLVPLAFRFKTFQKFKIFRF